MASGVSVPTFTFTNASSDIQTAVNLFERFGATRVLSNPRINAVNNQPALLTIATNKVYFKVDSTLIPATYNSATGTLLTPAVRNIKATPQTIPIGVVMSVLPSIDLEKREISINIKPTVSKIESELSDPSVEVLASDTTSSSSSSKSDSSSSSTKTAQNMIPVTGIRELDTIMKLGDGQLAVIGGFTDRRKTIEEKGIPVLMSIPWIGNFFKYKKESTDAIETVILLKATIIDSKGPKMDSFEKDIYNTFADDPRDYLNN